MGEEVWNCCGSATQCPAPHPAPSPMAQASGPERSFGLTDPARGCGVGVSSGKEQKEVATQCGWRSVGRGQGRIPLWDYKINKMSFLKQERGLGDDTAENQPYLHYMPWSSFPILKVWGAIFGPHNDGGALRC